MTLVIMAAGMGNRFGGLKQIEPVGPNGEFIIDYSIYDAIKAGYKKIVFVIKEENYNLFRDTIGKRVEGKIDVEYVFQDYSNVPSDINIPSERIKPLGTAHAVLCCKDIVKEPFTLINSDEFYGLKAFQDAYNFFNNNDDYNNYSTIVFKIKNTVPDEVSVNRGICKIRDNKLIDLKECKINGNINELIATPLDGSTSFKISDDDYASVNLFSFYPTVFKYFEEDFIYFLKNSNLLTDEYLLPKVICDHIKSNDIKCNVIYNSNRCISITNHEDLYEMKDYINEQIKNGVYPSNLYV